MKKDFSFIWFLIYALYIGLAALCTLGFLSLPLVVFLAAGSFVFAGKNALSAVLLNLTGGAVSLLLGHFGAAAFLISLALLVICAAAGVRRSVGFARTAVFLTAVVTVMFTAALCAAVYTDTGALSGSGIVKWLADIFEGASAAYGDAIMQMYGDRVADIGEVVSVLSSAMVNMFVGMAVCVSGIVGIVGSALAHKTADPKTKMLRTFKISPVGGAAFALGMAVLMFGSGASVVSAGNVYTALLPWFCVGGIKFLADFFRGKRRLSFFAVIMLVMIAFTADIAMALSLLGVIDTFWRVRANEK